MPEVRVCHKAKAALDAVSGRNFVEVLQNKCAELFSCDEWVVGPDSFSVYDVPVTGWSVQSDDVIIRVVLHPFQERVQSAYDSAKELALTAAAFFNSQQTMTLRGEVSVSVVLQFAHIEIADSSMQIA